MTSSEATSAAESDLPSDEQRAIDEAARDARIKYESERGLYEAFSAKLADVINDCLEEKKITVHSVTHRAKEAESFEKKASQPSPENPAFPKYSNPMGDITDKAGVRIIVYFLSTLKVVSKILDEQFEVIERQTKVSSEPDRLGYQSDHYLVKYLDARTAFPEYKRYAGLTAEIQVRTILQHAWAEIEHDVQYKAVTALPSQVRRRFASLAGLIEIADREFQAIEEADRELREQARRNVNLGQLNKVEITTDSLRAYLNKKYRADRRTTEFSHRWEAEFLQDLGFRNLAEVDMCVQAYDDDLISRVIYGGRQGQLTRFDAVLLAGMGENFIRAHPWSSAPGTAYWFLPREMHNLDKLRDAGITIGDYVPKEYPETALRGSDLAVLAEKYRKQAAESDGQPGSETPQPS